jgi:predicted porin
MTVRPTTRLAVESTVLENRFLTIDQNRNIFNNNIFRSKWNYQFTPRLSLRVIGQYSNVLPTAELSSLEYAKSLAGDVLVTYLLHPGTALYVGYSNMLENYNRLALEQAALLERSRAGLMSTAAGLFVKFSYLYHF